MSSGEFSHTPVLLPEVLEGLDIRPGGVYVDGTAGGAGHAAAIADKLSGGRLVALDRDPDAVKAARERLKEYPHAAVVQANFSDAAEVLGELGIREIDGMLLDLGVSSFQLDNPERGFTYHADDAPLDMRMSREGATAAELLNTLSVQELAGILSKYGEEKFAYRIAREIERRRGQAPIETAGQLTGIVQKAVPAAARRDKNPSRKTFQALRIAVNSELDALEKGLEAGFSLLKQGGRLAVITFHSLEDRLVKRYFAELCKGCVCPPDFPVCVCGRTPRGRLVNKKPIEASGAELEANRRSRSAKLRIIEKL